MTVKESRDNWFAKHADTIVLVGILIGGLWHINTRFFDMEKRFSDIETRLTRIETVLIMQKIMPQELCVVKEKPEDKK